ncbi:MAG: hypothetical protein ABI700_04565 [Chloroflexota bacterium]
MNDDQIQALEALFKATNGKSGAFVDLRRAQLSINVNTLLYLVKQGFIRMLGQKLFTLTVPGVAKALENRLTAVESSEMIR